MATRKYNGHKHHSRKQMSEPTHRRRLSKQEEIDLTVDGMDCNEKSNHLINGLNGETTFTPTIHVNSVEEKSGHKSMVNDKSEVCNDIDLNEQSVTKNIEELGKSIAIKLNVTESNNLSTDDNKEKKRGKCLARAEAVRDTSASPPPTQTSDNEDSLQSLSVISQNSQSQSGHLTSSNINNDKYQVNSSGSLDRSSPSLSRDSSTENYSDLTGTDVQQFLMETLQNNKKDRVFLLKIEQELNGLVKDKEKTTHKFFPMSSYNRMLVHRVAALFGFEHNVDITGNSVVVNKCKNTRTPDMKFKDFIKEDLEYEPKKSILKRDSASLEDGSSSSVSFDGKEKSPDRQNGIICDATRSKSFEEREERYEKARARIFNQDSSSSTEGNETNTHLTPNNSYTNLLQRNSSPRSSQSNEDLPKAENPILNTTDGSDHHKKEGKGPHPSIHLNCSSDSDSTPKSTPLSSSSSGRMNLLAPEGSRNNNGNNQSKNRPTVTKASSFGGISRNADNSSNITQNHLTKSGSFNVPQNVRQGQSPINALNSNRANTPKNSIRQESAQKSQTTSNYPEVRNVLSHQTSGHFTASHHNRHNNWHQNSHPRNVMRDAGFGHNIHWAHNYPHYVFQQQNDSNLNQLKESQYLQSGQQLYLSSVPAFGPAINNEPTGQHFTQQPIRLIYQNPNQPNVSSFNPLSFNSMAHTISNQMSSVPFPMQSSPPALNFSGNQSTLPTNPLMSHSYGAPLQMPSNVGAVWIINNGVNPQSSSPLMTCPSPANTPPTVSVGTNIAPFVGMSYQQYRPLNSNAPMNPNMSAPAAQNRGTAPLLKSQPLLATQANGGRIMASNGNHYIQQQVPDIVDINNLIGANNYMSRAQTGPPTNHLRRMPTNTNQGLDVRLVGSQASPPFLLPTPQRPYFPVSNSVPTAVTHRPFYANNANNANQRPKHSFSKSKPQNRFNANKNVLVPNANTNGSNF